MSNDMKNISVPPSVNSEEIQELFADLGEICKALHTYQRERQVELLKIIELRRMNDNLKNIHIAIKRLVN